MNTIEAEQFKAKHIRTAKALATVATCLGKAAKTRAKANPQDPALARSVRLLHTLAERLAAEIELARLYESFALDYKG